MSYELEFSQEALTEIKKLKKSRDRAVDTMAMGEK